MSADSVVTQEQRESAVKALEAIGYADFDHIGFSRGRFDSGTRGAFVAKGEFCVFVAPDNGDAAVLKATDETGEDSVKRMLAELAEEVATPIAPPVAVQTQAEFDYTPSRSTKAIRPTDSVHCVLKAKALARRMTFAGMDISIETDKGQQRHWHDEHSGESGSTTMLYPYGYIRRTEGADGEHVDVYVGPNQDAPTAFIVHQMKKPDFTEFDEDKVMLGFDSAEEAVGAYLVHYNDSRFFGSMSTMPVEQFRRLFVSDIDKAIAALKSMNAAFEPVVVAAPEQTDIEQSFLKSVGAQRFTPALRYRFAQSLAPKLAEQLAALQRAREAL